MNIIKQFLLGLAGIIGGQVAKSQQLDLQAYSKKQIQLQQTGMKVLGGWAIGNIITNAYLTGKSDAPAKYFNQMNVYWNIVNGALAGTALWRLSKKNKAEENFATVYKRQQSLEKTFLVNAGLDAAYIMGGIYLNEKSKNSVAHSSKLQGYGNSVVLQGAFLLLFDGVMYSLLHHKGKQLDKMLEKVQIDATGTGVSLLVNL